MSNLEQEQQTKVFSTRKELDDYIISQLKYLNKVAIKNGYRKYWLVIKAWDKFNKHLLKKNILWVLSTLTHISKKDILSYTKVLKEKGVKNQYTDVVDKAEGIERRPKDKMTADEKAAFYLINIINIRLDI